MYGTEAFRVSHNLTSPSWDVAMTEVLILFHLTWDAETIMLKVKAGLCLPSGIGTITLLQHTTLTIYLWPPVDLRSQMFKEASWDPEARIWLSLGFQSISEMYLVWDFRIWSCNRSLAGLTIWNIQFLIPEIRKSGSPEIRKSGRRLTG